MTENNEKDPIVERKIGNITLLMRVSHKLPQYYSMFPLYDRALPRICEKLKDIDGKLVAIDVGANVGDTTSLIASKVNGSFLCIDGDEEYLPLLRKNIENIKESQVFIEESYCSGNDKLKDVEVKRFDGTAKLVSRKEDTKKNLNFRSLDEIINEKSIFKNSNILKIDTDGFEIDVLGGAEELLVSAKPIIYFEFVPELYLENKYDPMHIFDFLNKKGYNNALFYDNFGLPIELVQTDDKRRINELIEMIDNNKIYYYDILKWHCSKEEKYETIFNNELKVTLDEM